MGFIIKKRGSVFAEMLNTATDEEVAIAAEGIRQPDSVMQRMAISSEEESHLLQAPKKAAGPKLGINVNPRKKKAASLYKAATKTGQTLKN